MRNKKLLSTVVATALAATMAMPVMAADGGSFDVTVTTKTPVIRVVVPTTMNIAVNQFEMGDPGSQIYSNEFKMENKSEIPVKMTVTSTATIPDTTTLVETKAAATSSTIAGEAWLAVAAQTSDGKYIEESGKTINDVTEASANVTTFKDKKAEQTYYLNASSTMAYKLLNASESAADIQYAQFYELTEKTLTANKEDEELAAALKEKDIYTVASASVADGAALTKFTSNDSYTTGNKYYEAAQTPTAKESIDGTKLYVYGDGTVDTAGKAAFRYIGKLSGKQETWTDTDLSKISVAYNIVGVQQNDYNALASEAGVLTYGLYKEPTPPAPSEAAPSIATTSYTLTADTPLTVNVALGAGNLAATSVSAVKNGATALPADAWSFSGGVLTFTAARVNTLVDANVSRVYTVVFNDTAKTTVDITLDGTH